MDSIKDLSGFSDLGPHKAIHINKPCQAIILLNIT